MPLPDSMNDAVQILVPLFRRFCVGTYSVALGGSLCKDTGDEHSDIDIYTFSDNVLLDAERTALVTEFVSPESQGLQASHLPPSNQYTQSNPNISCWSYCEGDTFAQGVTDFSWRGFRVEGWLRGINFTYRELSQCLEGKTRRDWVNWTVMGFFNHAWMSDVQTLQILEDPSGLLARWKEETAIYPELLRRNIITSYLNDARFWPGNLHYNSAIQRLDLIYTSGIVKQVIYSLVQMAFALNRIYFPGEKKLHESLSKLPLLPRDFVRRIELLLYPGSSSSADLALLTAQQLELAALVDEMQQLVAKD